MHKNYCISFSLPFIDSYYKYDSTQLLFLFFFSVSILIVRASFYYSSRRLISLVQMRVKETKYKMNMFHRCCLIILLVHWNSLPVLTRFFFYNWKCWEGKKYYSTDTTTTMTSRDSGVLFLLIKIFKNTTFYSVDHPKAVQTCYQYCWCRLFNEQDRCLTVVSRG